MYSLQYTLSYTYPQKLSQVGVIEKFYNGANYDRRECLMF